MNNELFDRMIKDNLQEMQVTPSAGVKKVLGWKLFFQNLVVFHKIKVAVGLLLVSGTSSYYFFGPGSEEGELLNGSYITELLDAEVQNESVQLIVEETSEVVINEKVTENFGKTKAEEAIGVTDDEANDVEKHEVIYEAQDDNNIVASDNQHNTKSTDNKGSDDGLHANEEKNQHIKNQVSVSDKPGDMNDIKDKNLSYDMTTSVAEEIIESEELFFAEPKEINLASVANLAVPQEAEEWNIEVKPGLFTELSFDLYKGVSGKSEISSELSSAIHRQYHWDFHGANDVLQMNVLGGANVNYVAGARVFRIKASAGISYYTLNDMKAVYEFEEITDPAWLDFFNTDEMAWVNTYGEDTCTQCFYAHSTEELKAELEQDYNRYEYLKVPLQLGTQFNFKYVSLDILGGLDMNILTRSRGLYVKEGLNPNYERFYYWDDLQLSTLGKGNEMLKKSFMTWSLATNVRVRVSKNFDLLAGYQINKSIGSITNDNYIMDKTLKASNMTIGLTFYPNRTKLNQKFVD